MSKLLLGHLRNGESHDMFFETLCSLINVENAFEMCLLKVSWSTFVCHNKRRGPYFYSRAAIVVVI